MRQTELKLSEEDRSVLQGIRSKGLHQAREVNRAHVLYCLDRDIPEAQIMSVLGIGRTAVWRARAAYLQGGATAKPATDKMLERLTAPAPAKEVEKPVVAPAPTVNQAKLESLAKPERAASETGAPTTAPVRPTSAAPATEAKPVDLSKANEKLSSLLNKPK